MEMPEDDGRAPTSMTIPIRNESPLRYIVSRSGTTVTLRFTEFATNISFAQAITMNAADHTWSVGEKTIEYTVTHGEVTTTPAVARGTVTGDVDSRVYKSILTAGPTWSRSTARSSPSTRSATTAAWARRSTWVDNRIPTARRAPS